MHLSRFMIGWEITGVIQNWTFVKAYFEDFHNFTWFRSRGLMRLPDLVGARVEVSGSEAGSQNVREGGPTWTFTLLFSAVFSSCPVHTALTRRHLHVLGQSNISLALAEKQLNSLTELR